MKIQAFVLFLAFTLLSVTQGFAQAVLRAGDTFEIRIGGVPADEASMFNSTYSIDSAGRLNLPHIGDVSVAGMTPGQAKDRIEGTYKSRGIYTNPVVNIVIAAQARQVSVGGAVKAPQRIAYTPDLTTLSAINAAGGFNEFANQKKVRVLRGGKQVIMVNCVEVRRNPALDVKLLPGDNIEVPESFW
ncbi:MAG: polysaccharide biosynthesis/export family protein [Verrucomicrobia bacterium]|nr:polysaccharide biosynthesis/export family protein [Verrucomicrobiota bacterium]